MGVQRHRRGQDDEEGDQVRHAHADEGVPANPVQFLGGGLRRGDQRGGALGLLFLDLLGALPEEQVGADGGAEDGHDHDDPALVRKAREDRMDGDLAPVDLDAEDDGDIGEQRQGQPLQQADIAMIRHEHLQQDRDQREGDGQQVLVGAGHQPSGGPHRRQIGADIDGVGEEQQADQGRDQPARQDLAEVGRQAMAGHAADAGADRLHRDHQRIGQDDGPQHVQAELGAGLRIGGDAAGIVVGRSGDQAGTQATQARRPPFALGFVVQRHARPLNASTGVIERVWRRRATRQMGRQDH